MRTLQISNNIALRRSYVVCLGMKRSGSTLQYNISRALLERTRPVTNLGYCPGENLSESIQSATGKLPTNSESILVKSHNPPWEFRLAAPPEAAFLYIYRDLRDVYASYKQKWGRSLDFFCRDTAAHLALYELYENDELVLTQKYEDLYHNKISGVIDISRYLGIDLDDATYSEIASDTSVEAFENFIRRRFVLGNPFAFYANRIIRWLPLSIRRQLSMSATLRAVKSHLFPLDTLSDKATQIHPNHFSRTRGKPNAWMDVLTDKETAVIDSEFGGWLDRHGYRAFGE
ncbi:MULTISPECIES: sulfotransferase domain-containing protein [unclassified Thiocapsa]|uniref:sulfotransferase domain-containing protein n=1 Tax=unclassified Thiocapsa TaxID=2641286 RepID=UPI0035B4DDEE